MGRGLVVPPTTSGMTARPRNRGVVALRNNYEIQRMICNRTDLTAPEKTVALVLTVYRNARTGLAWPSLQTIAKASGLARSTVCVALDGLAEKKVIFIEKDKGKSNGYRFNPSGSRTLTRGGLTRPAPGPKQYNICAEHFAAMTGEDFRAWLDTLSPGERSLVARSLKTGKTKGDQ